MSHLYVFISHITWLWFTKSYKTRNNGWSNVTGIFSYLARSGVVDGALLILQPTISWETWIRLKWRFDWIFSFWLNIFGGSPGFHEILPKSNLAYWPEYLKPLSVYDPIHTWYIQVLISNKPRTKRTPSLRCHIHHYLLHVGSCCSCFTF